MEMMASNNILGALINLDASISGGGAVKNSVAVMDQQEGLFQVVFLDADAESPLSPKGVDSQEVEQLFPKGIRAEGVKQPQSAPLVWKEDNMQTVLDQTEQKQDPDQDQKEVKVSSQELLSALSLLSIVGVIQAPVTYKSPATDEAAWGPKPFSPVVAPLSYQENIIQTILSNATPSLVTQTVLSDTNLNNRPVGVLADSDLDALISSLLLSKNKETENSKTLADLGWDHFNKAILTNADKGDSDLQGFTFTELSSEYTPLWHDGDLVKQEAQGKMLVEQATLSANFKMPTKQAESVGATLTATPFSLLDKTKDESIMPLDTHLSLNASDFVQTASITPQFQFDSVQTKSHAPSFRPESQIAEHAIVQQVAEKLSLYRFDSKGSEGITLELEPKELGALKIEISMHKNFVSADILTQHSSVRDILDKNQVLLRDAMAGMGFTVDHFSVNVGDFSQMPHHFSGQEQFHNEFGTKFALDNETEHSADLEWVAAGGSSSYWGDKESAISVYV